MNLKQFSNQLNLSIHPSIYSIYIYANEKWLRFMTDFWTLWDNLRWWMGKSCVIFVIETRFHNSRLLSMMVKLDVLQIGYELCYLDMSSLVWTLTSVVGVSWDLSVVPCSYQGSSIRPVHQRKETILSLVRNTVMYGAAGSGRVSLHAMFISLLLIISPLEADILA